jgi:anti-sigma B factor antagonist
MRKEQEDRTDGLLAVSSNRYGQEVTVVSLAGELDLSNVATAKQVLAETAREDAALLVIDLHHLEFLDSSGISLLVDLTRQRDAATLRIVPSPTREVSRMLDVTDIGSLIQIAPDAETAVAA